MSTKKAPKSAAGKKLRAKKQTIKDLSPSRATGVKGGSRPLFDYFNRPPSAK